MILDIVVATYHQDTVLKCFINCIKSQTNPNWRLILVHDGYDEFYERLEKSLTEDGYLNEKIILTHTGQRVADYGHTPLRFGVNKYVKDNRYVLLTNADNYYVPVLVEEVLSTASQFDNPKFIYWDCVHDYSRPYFDPPFGYGHLSSELEMNLIDRGCVAAMGSLAKVAEPDHVGGRCADWVYLDKMIRHIDSNGEPVKCQKITKILFVHN
jgi:hypothetical protein